MNLRSRNKVNATFNMSSLTDVVFLLLIFFMLTSTLVSPNALKLLLPQSDSQTRAKQTIAVSITEQQDYYVGEQQVSLSEMPGVLRQRLQDEEDPTVVVNADKNVPINNVVQVMNIGNDLKVKMILATRPEE